jgi:hypothetical protein
MFTQDFGYCGKRALVVPGIYSVCNYHKQAIEQLIRRSPVADYQEMRQWAERVLSAPTIYKDLQLPAKYVIELLNQSLPEETVQLAAELVAKDAEIEKLKWDNERLEIQRVNRNRAANRHLDRALRAEATLRKLGISEKELLNPKEGK